MLLTLKERSRRLLRPLLPNDESRYIKVKRSMASIKLVLDERKKIDEIKQIKRKPEIGEPS